MSKGWLFVKKKTPLHVVWAEMGFGPEEVFKTHGIHTPKP